MEDHESVAQGVASRQTDVKQPAVAPKTSTCVKSADSKNMTVQEDWMIPRQVAKEFNALHDRGPEQHDA